LMGLQVSLYVEHMRESTTSFSMKEMYLKQMEAIRQQSETDISLKTVDNLKLRSKLQDLQNYVAQVSSSCNYIRKACETQECPRQDIQSLAVVTLFEQYHIQDKHSEVLQQAVKVFNLTLLTKLLYTHKHSYGLFFYHDMELADQEVPPEWLKYKYIRRYLNNYNWIFWTCADALIVNSTVLLEDLLDSKYDFIFAERPDKKIDTCAFFVKNNDWTKHQLDNILNKYIKSKYDEAEIIQQIVQENSDRMKGVSMQTFFGDFLVNEEGKNYNEKLKIYTSQWEKASEGYKMPSYHFEALRSLHMFH